MSAMLSMKPQLAADLAGVFKYDFQAVAVVGGKEYTVLVNDDEKSEADAFGGPEMINAQEIHFQTSDLDIIENGILIDVYPQGTKGTKQALLVVSNIISADGAALVVKARAQ